MMSSSTTAPWKYATHHPNNNENHNYHASDRFGNKPQICHEAVDCCIKPNWINQLPEKQYKNENDNNEGNPTVTVGTN